MVNQNVSLESVLSHKLDIKKMKSNPQVSNDSANFFDILSGSQQSNQTSFQSIENANKSDFGFENKQSDISSNYSSYNQDSYAIDNSLKKRNQDDSRVRERKVDSGQELSKDVSKLDGRKKADKVKSAAKRVQLAEKMEQLEEEIEKLSNKKDSDKLQKKDLNKLKALLASLLQLLNGKPDEKELAAGVNSENVSLKKGLQKLLNLVGKKETKGKVDIKSLQKSDQSADLKGFLETVKSLLKDQGKLNEKRSVNKTGLESNNVSKSVKSKTLEEQAMAKIDVVNQSQNDFRKLASKPVFHNGQQKNVRPKVVSANNESQAVGINAQKVESSSSLSSGAEQFMSFDDKASDMKGVQIFKQKTGVKNPKKIFNQIVEHAKVTMKSGMKEMKVQLNPKILGKIGIKLSLKDGQMTAQLDVANSALRSLLKDNLSVLESQLRESGLNLVSLDVSSHGGNQSNFSEMMNRDDKQKDNVALKSGNGVGKTEEIGSDLNMQKQQDGSGKIDLVA